MLERSIKMKKTIKVFILLFVFLALITSLLTIQKNESNKTQDYAARVPLPIPPPPNSLK